MTSFFIRTCRCIKYITKPLSNFCGRIVFESILVSVLFFMFCFLEYSNNSGAYLQRIWCRHLQIYLQTLKTCRTDPAGAASGVHPRQISLKVSESNGIIKISMSLLATNPQKYLTIKYLDFNTWNIRHNIFHWNRLYQIVSL